MTKQKPRLLLETDAPVKRETSGIYPARFCFAFNNDSFDRHPRGLSPSTGRALLSRADLF
jgi:hypothetical protein